MNVFLFDSLMGTVFSDGEIKFQYDPVFRKLELEPSPFHLPVSNRIYIFSSHKFDHFKNLPGLLADSLPDKFGTNLLTVYLQQQNKRAADLTPLERLSYVGERGMGALTYKPAAPLEESHSAINLKALETISQQLEKEISRVNWKDQKAIRDLAAIGGSAGGAKAKAIIYRKGKEILPGYIKNPPAGYKAEIIKIVLPYLKDYSKLEYIFSLLARLSGITMMPCELITIEDSCYFTTERFDRIGERKLHVQTLAALQHLDFTSDSMGFESIASTIIQLTHDQQQVEEMFRRVVFNIVIGNCDDHLKNTSFLMNEKGQWKLSPAYDLTHSYSADESAFNSYHHISVSKKNNDITEKDLLEAASQFGIRHAKQIIEQVVSTFDSFASLCKKYEVANYAVKKVLETTKAIQKRLALSR